MSMKYYELVWTSEDGQADMTGGNYVSKEDALAAIKAVRKEFIDIANGDEEMEAQIKAGSFEVYYRGPEIVVEDIRIEENEGDLFAYFTVRQIEWNGDETSTSTGEWIDYEDGHLLDSVDSNFYVNHRGEFGDDGEDKIYGIVNDHLRANPIDEDLLESYQQAAEARHEASREEANALSM